MGRLLQYNSLGLLTGFLAKTYECKLFLHNFHHRLNPLISDNLIRSLARFVVQQEEKHQTHEKALVHEFGTGRRCGWQGGVGDGWLL
jgi:hypothetical protein